MKISYIAIFVTPDLIYLVMYFLCEQFKHIVGL